jgi:hypothetical protein
MQLKTVKTFTATIYVGSKVREIGEIIPLTKATEWLQSYVDRVGLCVTCTPTEFIYSNGSEPGLIVGLINYPRFPSHSALIAKQALEIAEELRVIMQQQKVSVVFPTETVTLGEC